MNGNNTLEVKDLKKYFSIKGGFFSKESGYVKAVDGVSFSIKLGETLGLVGESGCGKTTTGMLILRLIEITDGEVLYNGENISDLKDDKGFRKIFQVIFQNPYSSLNPRIKIGSMLAEILRFHKVASGRELKEKVKKILLDVGISPSDADKYPYEFSGGQRQRIAIARAISLNPEFIVADEPVSALDVSVQAQIINLLKDLRELLNLTFLFISHNLSVIRQVSDNVAVMYLGKIVEIASCDELFKHPAHPYTKALLSAVPVLNPEEKTSRITLKGDIPNPANTPSGCYFHPRCGYAMERCKIDVPNLKKLSDNHKVSCLMNSGYGIG